MDSFRVLAEYCDAGARGLCLGARFGDEVVALHACGYIGSIGVDLQACPPRVVAGDFHALPFSDGEFDFVFSNAVDHVYNLDGFCGEVDRVVKPVGLALFHVAVNHFDEYESLQIESTSEVVAAMKGWTFLTGLSVPYETDKLTGMLFARGPHV